MTEQDIILQHTNTKESVQTTKGPEKKSRPKTYNVILFFLLLAGSMVPYVTAPVALFAGILMALTSGNPFAGKTQKVTHQLLQVSVVGLGFGMNAAVAIEAGRSGIIYTVLGIATTFTLGYFISKVLKLKKNTAILISAGTAICGGSAIAAVAPVINADNEDTSVSLGVVFILNSIALILFPIAGHYLGLNESQFGIWAAIAIHDTSSVVGASSSYGKLALATATTIKLTRALWIIPVTFIAAVMVKTGTKKIKIPYFVFGFLIAMLANTYLPVFRNIFNIVYMVAHQALVTTLFLIGANLSKNTIKKVGVVPFIMGTTLWMIISVLSLVVVW